MNAARLSLIRFVTARQFELRGLREVVFGIFICVAIPLLLWRRESGAQGGWLIHLALYIVVQEFALQFVDRRYDSTYGRVNPSDAQPAKSRWARPTIAQSLLGAGVVLDMTPWFPVWGVSAFPIVIAIYGLWIAFRDVPWRLYYVGTLAVLVATPAVDDPSRLTSFLPAYFACGVTLVLAGLFDHLLLAGVVARLRRQGVPESAAGTR